ncbi:hypothetical protein H0H92_011872 [Tricholoma furcatifolium]|nr:hypothetical protein H0H92_011872 [Tricholoma furcatifolium]
MPVSTAETFLTNCLSDIIKLARELKVSVEKIPQHRRKVRKLSDELLAGVLDIETFYNARRGRNILEKTPELAEGLPNLLEKITATQERCEQLTAPTQSKGWRKVGAALKAWKECDQVEEEISDLKDLAHVLYRKLTMSIVASIEDSASSDATTLVRLGENQNEMLGNMESFLTTLQGPQTTPIFVQPSQDVINALYLHHQVETISNSLADLSTTQTFADEDPKDHYLAPFKPVVSRPISASTLDDEHREVVAKTLEIISLLKGDSSDLSVQDGAWEMVNLAIKLYGLEMYSDAESMGKWTATMYRALVETNRAVYEPYLALSLRNLSRYKAQIKDHEGSAAAIHESLDIQRRQVQENPTLENRSQLANTLCEYWASETRNSDNLKHGLEIAKEAVSITESIRTDLSTWNTWLETSPPPYIEAAYVQVEEAETIPPPQLDDDETLWLDYNTARALSCLSFSLQDNDRIDEAYEAELRSLAAYQALNERHAEQFIENLAGSYAHLAGPVLRTGRPVDKSLEYAERAVEIYRTRVDVQPVKVMPWLVDSLWDYASILHDAGRTDDVRRVTDEALELIRKSNKTQKLLADALYTSCGKLRKLECKQVAVDLRKEAVGIYRTLVISEPTPAPSQPEPSASIEVIDSTTLPDTLMDLANDFVLVDKPVDAVIACQEAVDIYRARLKEDKDSADAHLNLARSISYLSYCTFVKKDYEAAAKLGHESITIYSAQYKAMGPDFKSVDNYISALRRTSAATFYSPSTNALATNAAVIESLRLLIADHKDKVGKSLLNSLHDRDFILGKYGRIREAIPVIEQALELCKPVSNSAIAADFISASDSYAGSLYDIGRFNDSLLVCEKAIDSGISFTSEADIKAVAPALAGLRATQAAFLFNQGRYAEAEVMMKISLDSTRALEPPADDTLLACRLRTYAGVLRKLGRLEEALKLGEEAVKLCRESTSKALFASVRLPYNIESYAASVADSGDDTQALALIRESIELYRKFRDGPYDPLAPWGYIEPIYSEALVLLATCLMATGDSEAAHEALIEAQGIYQGMIINKPGQLMDFLSCLDLLALNMRARGLLDEEKRIAADLDDRQRALQFLYPELVSSARISLEEFRSRPSQVRLRARFATLPPPSV